MKPFVLVVDDEPDIRRLVREILEDEGYAVAVAKDGAAARDSVAARTPDLILLDIWMPDVDGISLLKEFVSVYKLQCPVVMMSGHGTVEAAVEATRLGAHDFIEKPLSLAKLLLTVEQALASGQGNARSLASGHEVIEPVELTGKSEMAVQLNKTLDQCAKHDITVLMTGEAGVGKTHCARYIHTHGKRSGGPFVELHTALLTSSHSDQGNELLLGKEDKSGIHAGYLEQASGGTLFIDDVAELDDNTQAGLLGVLTSPRFYRVNGDELISSDVRVIVATRYDLHREMQAGRFREDLYHCLNEYPVVISPLRDHGEDVTELVHHYVRLFSDQEGLPYRDFSMAAQNRLRNYDWPGNILELENMVRRLLIVDNSGPVELVEIEQVIQATASQEKSFTADLQAEPVFGLPLRQAREQFERAYLEYHLSQLEGSVGKVARQAGMERTHLYRKLRALGIDTKSAAQTSAKD